MPQSWTPSATVTSDPSPIGARRMAVGSVTIGDNYVAGGVPFSPALCGLSAIDYIDFGPNQNMARVARWNPGQPGQGTIQIGAGGAELGAGVATAVGDVYPCVVFGI